MALHGWWLLATAVAALVVTVAAGWFLFPVTALLTPRGFTPSGASSSGSLDEGVRNATAATAHGSHHGRGGMP